MNLPFYRLSRACVRLCFQVLFGFRTIGDERVPRTGPLIVACNHVSNLDPPALGVALPRPVTYMAKKELFAMPALGPVITALGAFPVDRSRGDLAAVKVAIAVLERGACLGIFPEGGRNPDGTKEPQSGVALLASLSGATVIPAYVSGTSQSKFRRRVTVVFGEPLRFESGAPAPVSEPSAPAPVSEPSTAAPAIEPGAGAPGIKQNQKARRDDLAKWTRELMSKIYALREIADGH